jgi:integrase
VCLRTVRGIPAKRRILRTCFGEMLNLRARAAAWMPQRSNLMIFSRSHESSLVRWPRKQAYLPFTKRDKKPSTYHGYLDYWKRYIKPRVGNRLLRDFTVAVISRLLRDAASTHSLNEDTCGKIRSVLSGIFTYAMGNGDFPGKCAADNPASCALIPEAATEPEATTAPTREAVKKILAHLQAEGLMLERAAVAIIAFTGVRPSEARGLRWEDWSRTPDHIAITLWRAIEGTTKTKQSVRLVPVVPELREILLSLWRLEGSPLSGYILAREGGGRVNLDNMSKRTIIPTLAKAGIEWPAWYSLRRFHGTSVCVESNADTMARALGNSKQVAIDH